MPASGQPRYAYLIDGAQAASLSALSHAAGLALEQAKQGEYKLQTMIILICQSKTFRES